MPSFIAADNHTANTFAEKANVLKEAFFSAPPNADLRDLEDFTCPVA